MAAPEETPAHSKRMPLPEYPPHAIRSCGGGNLRLVQKRVILQLSGPGRVFKGLGVAKAYWGYDSNGAKSNAKACWR